jgi:hypothetical protein
MVALASFNPIQYFSGDQVGHASSVTVLLENNENSRS